MNAPHISFHTAEIAARQPLRDAVAAAVAVYEATAAYRHLVALAQSGYGR